MIMKSGEIHAASPDKSELRKQARCINDGVKFDKTNTRIMKARVEIDEQAGKVVIITEQVRSIVLPPLAGR